MEKPQENRTHPDLEYINDQGGYYYCKRNKGFRI